MKQEKKITAIENVIIITILKHLEIMNVLQQLNAKGNIIKK